jgi:hypothetical protein
MAKQNTRHRWPWTTDEVKQLKVLLKQNTPTPILALKLKRTERSIRSKVSRVSIRSTPNWLMLYEIRPALRRHRLKSFGVVTKICTVWTSRAIINLDRGSTLGTRRLAQGYASPEQ